MFNKVLVANRGEIALRVIRTLREMGIPSVAVYSDADRDALFALEADEAHHIGPAPAPQSYLNIDAILGAIRSCHADAVHPGYGFLAENAGFAEAVQSTGATFIGPHPQALRVMGDKVAARRAVAKLGVPLVPGTHGPVESVEEAISFADSAGYPVAVKAAGGGGGRGIRVVERAEDMAASLEAARREAGTFFKNPEVYVEKYFHDPRHVEIQIMADAHGRTVYLGERDCSVQRRHQKMIEESPSPAVDSRLREQMGDMAIRAAESVEYNSAGTVEFLLTRDGHFYFLEMNTRVQVEHPVTEMVTGVDIVREMILAASGEPLTVRNSIFDLNGHAIEIRINAEDPKNGFRPTPGAITGYLAPGGPGIRVDAGVYAGYTVPGVYDSLIAKLIAWGPDREAARKRALRALREYVIEGPSTTIPFAGAVLEHPTFVAGEVGTSFLAEQLEELVAASEGFERPGLPVAVPAAQAGPGRSFDVEVNRKVFRVRVAEVGDGSRQGRPKVARRTGSRPAGNDLQSPMNGTVVSVRKEEGSEVAEGDVVLIVEAMKMENEIAAHRSGTLRSVAVKTGDAVETGQRLAVIE